MLLNKDNLIQQLSLSHFELVHLKTGKLGPCWSKLEFGRKVLSLSRPHKYWPLGQRSLKGHQSQVSIFLFYSSDIIASSWCILSAISHVGVGDKISVRFRFAVLHIISVSTHSNLNHHFKNYQLFSYVDLNRLCPWALRFGSIDLRHFWKPVNRLTITMGKLGCTRNPTSTCCMSEKGKRFV